MPLTPMAIYEIHLGSWRRRPEEGDRHLTYRELAQYLPEYIKKLGFTHVEFLPLMEHPFYGSWGYEVSGYFTPTSRYGTPQDLMYLIDSLHQHGISVILDCVPAHFPKDEHALGYFDGVHLFEHADPRQGIHPDWDSFIFNYGRNEVRSFLTSNALFWLDKFHIDGLRIDAVASMLYLITRARGGNGSPTNTGAGKICSYRVLRRFRGDLQELPDVQTIAEDHHGPWFLDRSTSAARVWTQVGHGWMHDTLSYMSGIPFIENIITMK
jgi:1,4-alpha-glucan branching enzyme